jgi:hypothetical protein
MNCKTAWQNSFIDDNLSNNFRSGELRKHREDILLDREKSMLPATIPHAEHELFKKKKHEEVLILLKEQNDLYKQIDNIKHKIFELHTEIGNTTIINKKSTFIRKCPTDNCRGFLCDKWKCGICECVVCSKCHDIKEDKHECNEESLKTAELLSKDTKPCVNCGSLIFKIEGCNQIFCTECHTAFDWVTGKIETKNIHNPHYFEWLRNNNDGGEIPRNPGDEICGGIPNYHTITAHIRQYKLVFHFDDYYRIISHMREVELPRYVFANIEDRNIDLRIKYLLKEISEDYWKKELQTRERKLIKKNEMRQLIDMFITIGTDLTIKILSIKKQVEIENLKLEYKKLREYFNENLLLTYKRLGSKSTKQICENWYF